MVYFHFLLLFRLCRFVSFVYTFGYLFFFRTCAQFGFKQPTGQSNAVQLLVTLRVSGFQMQSLMKVQLHVMYPHKRNCFKVKNPREISAE
jgi:hypothetical protein